MKSLTGEPTSTHKGSDASTEKGFNDLFPWKNNSTESRSPEAHGVFVSEFNSAPEIWVGFEEEPTGKRGRGKDHSLPASQGRASAQN